jgi:hypothetical protein
MAWVALVLAALALALALAAEVAIIRRHKRIADELTGAALVVLILAAGVGLADYAQGRATCDARGGAYSYAQGCRLDPLEER